MKKYPRENVIDYCMACELLLPIPGFIKLNFIMMQSMKSMLK